MNEVFDGARVFLCLAFLMYASWSDLKKREVSNIVWAFFAPIAFAFTFSQFFMFAPQLLHIYALSFTITSALSIALFYAGAFGGADAKALICISIVLPHYPTNLLQTPPSLLLPLFPITVFTNAILLAALSAFYAIIRNCLWKRGTKKGLFEGFEKEPKWRKVMTLLCGYKVEIAELERKEHLYPLEDILVNETETSQRKLLLMPKDEERGEIVKRILKASSEGRLQDEVWITPGLPLLIFITAGLIIALIFGDLIWIALRFGFGMGK